MVWALCSKGLLPLAKPCKRMASGRGGSRFFRRYSISHAGRADVPAWVADWCSRYLLAGASVDSAVPSTIIAPQPSMAGVMASCRKIRP